MRELVPSIAAALTPLILLVILLVGPTLGLVKWQPSLLWHTEFGAVGHGITSKVTAISVDKTGLYTAGYLGTYSNVTGPSSYSFLNKFDFSGTQVWSTQAPVESMYRGQMTRAWACLILTRLCPSTIQAGLFNGGVSLTSPALRAGVGRRGSQVTRQGFTFLDGLTMLFQGNRMVVSRTRFLGSTT